MHHLTVPVKPELPEYGDRMHEHSHQHHDLLVTDRVRRSLWIAVAGWAVVSLIALIALWPTKQIGHSSDLAENRVNATVESVEVKACTGTDVADLVECRFLTMRVSSGARAGQTAVLELGVSSSKVRQAQVGDGLVLIEQTLDSGEASYAFADYQRAGSMLILVLLFAVAVLLLGRLRGLGALAGLGLSVAVLLIFMLPALLQGSNPILVSIVAASVIAFASLYLAHGFSSATNVALLSTLLALSLTGLLAWAFIGLTSLTGFTDESSFYLEALGVNIDPRGLLLAGIVIGALGVLDDVTVTQVSAVGALSEAQPSLSATELYRRALSIGRDHISSTVNTLFLAYAGAALPLLLLFTETGQRIGSVALRETVAVEVVRTLVGSIGLVAAVPISTGLAAVILAGSGSGSGSGNGSPGHGHDIASVADLGN